MEYALIALEHASGNVSRMQFGTYRKRHQIDDALAVKAGFKLDPEGNWRRDLSDGNIEAEIAKTLLPEPVTRWWRVTEDEVLPPRRRSVRGNVIDLVPEDPLPRFLGQPSVAPEMQATLADFERRVAEVQARPIPHIPEDLASRIAALEGFQVEIIRRFDALKENFAVALEKLGGKT